jgi:hypothetical protein
MAYISSRDNRFYVALEQSYGHAAASGSFSRIPAVKLVARQQRERAERKDKTGSRTFAGYPAGGRRATTYELHTYMRDWPDQTREPGYGPLFQACFGRPAAMASQLPISAVSNPNHITFGAPHGLTPGQAVAYGADLRFVAAVVDDHTVQVNAPFSVQPAVGTTTGITATYGPGTELSSATILDFWSPGTAVQRLIYGAAVDDLQIHVNGDFHGFQFSGPACDIADSSSFQQGQAGLNAFPAEPAPANFDYAIVPGHLGQVWLGSAPDQFFTVTTATVKFANNAGLRDHEFGSILARGISPGVRSVTVDLNIYQQDDAQTKALYQAARQESPVSVMLQLGQQPGQLTGIYLKGVILATPEFDDAEMRQQWVFKNCRAQGIADDEISIAFG